VVAVTLVLSLLAIASPLAGGTEGGVFASLFVSAALLILLAGFSSAAAEVKMIYVWVWVSFIGYVFFVDHPRTHLQIIYPGWSLLVALAAGGLASILPSRLAVLRRRWARVGAVVISCLLFGLFAGYEYLLFVDARSEYILTYPDHKSPLYWEDARFPFGSRRLYGAPHRLGWQMIHSLYAQRYLQGDWDSNDHGSNLFWYTLGVPRNPCYPRYYFLTQFEQRDKSEEDSSQPALAGYARIGQVWNHDRLQIDVYEFAPMGRTEEMTIWSEPARYTSFVVPGDFHSLPYEKTAPNMANPLPVPPTFRPGPLALKQIADQYGDQRILNVRDKVALMGYDLDETWARPGGLAVLTLYWQAVEVVNLPYKIFVHLESSDGKALAQADDFPACGTRSTQHWPVGQTIVDRHIVRLPADIPPGDYLLRVGLYEPQTGLRMDLLDAQGNPQGNSFDLTQATVRSAN
jgi:hypothetical protein